MVDAAKLQQVKDRTWFYEFDLPDGTRTATDIPADVLPIHTSRRDKLAWIIQNRVPDAQDLTAFDLASHEGYYSLELARHFKSVRGYEIRKSSRDAARLITDVIGAPNIDYVEADLQTMAFDPAQTADFVLLYGLIYHLENPVHTIRLASQMARKHILIETQVFPYDISGQLEDGHYKHMRPIEGVFGLAPDYAARREGGSTDIAVVPSLNALLFLLRNFGFSEVFVLPSGDDDYEQFRRGSHVVVYGGKP
ncbi:class I SAM-dependent methyltransferase [Azorhizobium doebereinerae]|uniref:class I SAM-dependent methyltransferase n=1 Tax=Azorhizobium doebereinerae TaxID=281091 RepID=UPI0004089BA8|nr:methyltransferase domain-containing protein [Azorhizobium doebereinerae]